MENQTNAPTISSNEPLDNIQEHEVEESTQYPDRPGEPNCLYYLRSGKCGYGANCRYNHPSNVVVKTDEDSSEFPQREGQPDCGYYMKTGACKFGSSCKYHHPLDRRGAGHILLNTFDLPIREGEKHCPYYMRTYTCKFGRACKFDHPQPSTLECTSSVPGVSAIGTMGPSLISNGITCVSTIPKWSLPNSSCVPSSQTYMPFFSYSQSPFIAQGWNNYVGNLNSVPAPHMMLQNFVYNSSSQGQPVSGGLGEGLTQAISYLPQRPDQPECRYFLSTGSCKFGPVCKFHHPKERVALNVGPHGLPLRPGQDLCYDFSSYGVCQHGPTCKFDHPVYPAGYYIAPGARNTFIISNPTEASQSKSSKITNWIKKLETVADKNRQSSVKKSVEAPRKEVHDDHPDDTITAAAPTSSEHLED